MKNEKRSAAKAAYEQYRKSLDDEKRSISSEPRRWKRFRLRVWLVVAWPWKWLWMACHDWRMVLIYVGWMAVVGCEVWVPLVIAWLTTDSSLRAWMLSIAGTCEAFWLGPFTPFMPLCIALTIGTKALIDKAVERKSRKERGKEGGQTMTERQKERLKSVGYSENCFHSYFLKTRIVDIGAIHREAASFVDERSGEIRCHGDSELCEELKEEAEDALKEGNE